MSSLDRILRRSPLQAISAWAKAGDVAILAFHGVDDPENFANQMDYLAEHYRPISIEDLDGAMRGGGQLEDRSVLVTFDDGHRSVLDHALPILSERGIPGVAFVIAGLLSTSQDFWWSAVLDLVSHGGRVAGHEHMNGHELVRYLKMVDNETRLEAMAELEWSARGSPSPRHQLEEHELALMESGGISIGNHTWSHPCLNRCGRETTRAEIEQAHHRLAGLLGRPPEWFAFPNGDWAEEADTTLRDLGYRLGFLFDHHHARLSSDALRVSRLRVNSDTKPDRFAMILSGLHPSLHHARGRG